MLFWQAEVGKGANVFNRKIVCTSFANGKRHDFRIFKESMLSSFS
ncbi:transposase [Wolbachia endosymbiont of Armadillidium vulgare str. wVulC]|nr:transposase [Wolbachia endosymbiont of Armadillidium vulgare str. wVulC]